MVEAKGLVGNGLYDLLCTMLLY